MGDIVSTVIQTPETGAVAPVVPKEDNRPAWLPEKFKTPEDLAKSYSELEKKLSTQNNQPPNKEATPPPANPEQTPEAQAQEAVTKAGLDMKALEDEVSKSGDLSPESFQKLEAAGISKEQVAIYRDGLAARSSKFETDMVKAAGVNQDQVSEALKWAQKNMAPEQAAAYDKAVTSGDPLLGALAIKGLVADYKATLEPQFIGGSRPSNNPDVFASRAEQTRAMQDPRYSTDPAYRKSVELKSMRSF